MTNRSGSTLATVVILMTVLAILVMIFLSFQTNTLQGFKNRKAHLQALADTRSQVLVAMNSISSEINVDTSAINKPLFEDSVKSTDSATLAMTPFSVMITGKMKSPIATIVCSAETGSQFTPNDTTVIFCSPSTVEAPNLRGTKAICENDSSKKAFPLNKAGAAKAKSWISRMTTIQGEPMQNPIIVSTSRGLESRSDTINAPLFFNATSAELRIDGKGRTFIVKGDIQFTGKVSLRNCTLISCGEVRINDKANLKGVDIYTAHRLFLADESKFSGRIAALEQVELFGQSKVSDESMIISFAEKKNVDSSAALKSGAISVRERANISGSLITLGKDGIVTELDTKTSGLLWSKTWIKHSGTHKGLVRAVSYVGDQPSTVSLPGTADAPTVQKIAGRIEPPFGKVPYPLPWYIGKPELISWREWNE